MNDNDTTAAVLDQQRVLGRVAAALEAELRHGCKVLSDETIVAILARPGVAEALEAWRKEQGQ